MTLTINTNVSSLIAQRNLNSATSALNTSIERMTTGYKVNRARDNAADYAIANLWTTQLSSLDVASSNAAMGQDMLSTAEDTINLLLSHFQRVRDLTEQAANGVYSSDSLDTIVAEATARMEEIDRIAANCEYNGLHLLNASISSPLKLQVGIHATDTNQITLKKELFAKADVKALCGSETATFAPTIKTAPTTALGKIDEAVKALSDRATSIGAIQNRLDSAIEAIDIQTQNMTSSLSTLKDADVAEESSNYIKAQILQQASATLLATANQLPSIALNLI